MNSNQNSGVPTSTNNGKIRSVRQMIRAGGELRRRERRRELPAEILSARLFNVCRVQVDRPPQSGCPSHRILADAGARVPIGAQVL